MRLASNAQVVELVEHFRLEAEDHGTYSLISVPDRQRRGGRKYEKWIRQKPIGQGSFGIVWLEARDDGVSGSQEPEVRAVKQIVKGITSPESFGTNCARELYAMARLMKHPDHFADFFGWFETDESVYFSMEYFSCGDLGTCVKTPMASDEARTITSQLLDGLKIIHQNGITHRDLKPSNVFVKSRDPWWVKIGDFGISKRIGQSTYLHTVTGTTHFMGPEIAECDAEKGYTNAVDMWSLGCVLFYIMTTEIPFEKRALERYVASKQDFPEKLLVDRGASTPSIQLTKGLLAPRPEQRLSAETAAQSQWFKESGQPVMIGNLKNFSRPSTHAPEPQLSHASNQPKTSGVPGRAWERLTPKSRTASRAAVAGGPPRPVRKLSGKPSSLLPHNPVFGMSLDELLQRDDIMVPLIVKQCVQAVESFGLDTEGIYQITGSAQNITELRDLFDHDSSKVDLRNSDVFQNDIKAVATVLKQFFHELKEPLFTNKCDGLYQAARMQDDLSRRDSLHALINVLPDPNYATLRVLMLHLHRVAQHSAQNGMKKSTLALFWGSTLVIGGKRDLSDSGLMIPIILTILDHVYEIFDGD